MRLDEYQSNKNFHSDYCNIDLYVVFFSNPKPLNSFYPGIITVINAHKNFLFNSSLNHCGIYKYTIKSLCLYICLDAKCICYSNSCTANKKYILNLFVLHWKVLLVAIASRCFTKLISKRWINQQIVKCKTYLALRRSLIKCFIL